MNHGKQTLQIPFKKVAFKLFTRNLGAALPRAVMSLPAHDGTRRTTNIVLAESVNLSISFQEYVTIFIIFCPISFLFIVIS